MAQKEANRKRNVQFKAINYENYNQNIIEGYKNIDDPKIQN